MEQNPNSLAARYGLAQSLISWAWEARGFGWASDVTEEGGKLFKERLLMARSVLDPIKNQKEDPYLFGLRIELGVGLGSSLDEVEHEIQNGVQAGGVAGPKLLEIPVGWMPQRLGPPSSPRRESQQRGGVQPRHEEERKSLTEPGDGQRKLERRPRFGGIKFYQALVDHPGEPNNRALRPACADIARL